MRSMLIGLLLIPGLASAANVGQWIAESTGDSVAVRITGQEKYEVTIETSREGSSCFFREIVDEVEEGDLRFETPSCSLAVQQLLDENTEEEYVKVSAQGCRSYCQEGISLSISRANVPK